MNVKSGSEKNMMVYINILKPKGIYIMENIIQ